MIIVILTTVAGVFILTDLFGVERNFLTVVAAIVATRVIVTLFNMMFGTIFMFRMQRKMNRIERKANKPGRPN